MGEPKMESQSMNFTEEELKNRAKAQSQDERYLGEVSEFKKEKSAMEIGGVEPLQAEYEKYQLAVAFGLSEDAAKYLDNMKSLFNEAGEKMNEGGEYDLIKKQLLNRIFQGEMTVVDKDKDFNVLAAMLKEKFGDPIVVSQEGAIPGKAEGEFTRIQNTRYVAHLFVNGAGSRAINVKRWEDSQLTKLEEISRQIEQAKAEEFEKMDKTAAEEFGKNLNS